MNITIHTPSATPFTDGAAHEAITAERATGAEAKAENARQIASLSSFASSGQQAEHIRGLVATTMAHLSKQASPATLENAAQWQTWALGQASGIEVQANC
jgi:hypothetical protein